MSLAQSPKQKATEDEVRPVRHALRLVSEQMGDEQPGNEPGDEQPEGETGDETGGGSGNLRSRASGNVRCRARKLATSGAADRTSAKAWGRLERSASSSAAPAAAAAQWAFEGVRSGHPRHRRTHLGGPAPKGCVHAPQRFGGRPRGAFGPPPLPAFDGPAGTPPPRTRPACGAGGCSRGVACCNTLQEICRGEAPPRHLNAPGAPRAHASASPAPGVDREPSL